MSFFKSHREAASEVGEATNHLTSIRSYESGQGDSVSLSPQQWDDACWEGVPKEMINSVNMNFSLNFIDICTSVDLTVSNKIQKISGNGINSINTNKCVSLPLYTHPKNRVRVTFSSTNDFGPRKDLIAMSGNNIPSAGIVTKLAGMTSGTELFNLNKDTVSVASSITSNGTDMRKMALKAVLLKNQLIMMHASSRHYSVHAKKQSYPVLHSTGAEVLHAKGEANMVVNIDDTSCTHRPIICALAMAWPCQTLTREGGKDVYSQVEIGADLPIFYSPSGGIKEIEFHGLTVDPKVYWNSVVQLFNTLGGLSHLAQVCRETRGFAPCLIDIAKSLTRNVLDVNLSYGQTRCMSAIDVGSAVHKGHHVTPSELESSSSVLMIDNLMMLHMRNNMHYFGESLGLFSKSLVTRPITNCRRVKDILLCHGLRMRGYDNPIYGAIMPWLCDMAGCQEYILTKMFSIVTEALGSHPGEPTILPSIGWRSTPSVAGTTQRALGLNMQITSSMQSGIHTSKQVLKDCLRMSDWAKAVNLAEGVPKGSTTYLGVKTFPSDHNATLNSVAHLDGTYKLESVTITIKYPDHRVSGDVTIGSFFSGDTRPRVEGGAALEGQLIVTDNKTLGVSSFCRLQPVAPSTGAKSTRNDTAWVNAADCAASTSPSESSTEGSSSLDVVPARDPSTVGGHLSDYIGGGLDYSPAHNEYNDGNCGMGALKAGFASLGIPFDMQEELNALALKLDDRLFLYDDQLAAVAASKNHSLVIIPEAGAGNIPRVFQAEDPEGTVVIFAKPGHYSPAIRSGRENKSLKDLAPVTVCKPPDMVSTKRAVASDKLKRSTAPNRSNMQGYVDYEQDRPKNNK